MENYLSYRQQRVFCNNTSSECRPVTTGVPQGCSLGPLLFMVYINDLPDIINNAHTILFADDTVLFHISHSVESSINLVQSDLNNLHLWCRDNLLDLNIKKKNVCFFPQRNPKCHAKIT